MSRVLRGLAVAALVAGTTALAADKPAQPETFSKTAKRPPVVIAPPSAEVVAEAIRAEMDAYARRLDACTRLRQIAVETNNDALLNEVDEIERQASAIYQARVSRLGIKSSDTSKTAKLPETRVPAGVDPTKVGAPTPGRAK